MLLLRPKRPVGIKRNNNANPNKEVVTIAQTYFAVQTRK